MKVLVIPDVHLKPWIFDQAFNEDLCWVDTVTGEWGIL